MPEVFPVTHSHEIDGTEFIRLVGVFSTRGEADAAAARAAELPGFDETRDGIHVGSATLGAPRWTEGFV